ncbi:alpha-L-rhamnosidase C-terminal domain-containing protein [Leifsonia xyli]|uniref:alpha-L-rhamnosidase C-terminal domain-containing protein n=1 Tax=Leifsonia xyli TaxID=1575 RepID=UPI003D671E28
MAVSTGCRDRTTRGWLQAVPCRPAHGGGLTSAEGVVVTPYGQASSSWMLTQSEFTLRVRVPVSTVCEVQLPDGTRAEVGSGEHEFVASIGALADR